MRSPRSLSATTQFRRVFSHGRRGRSDGLRVWVLRRPGEQVGLGLAVGSAVGGAVRRNRLRRRLREVIRTAPVTDMDIVITAERDAGQLSYQELAEHVLRALASAGVVPR